MVEKNTVVQSLQHIMRGYRGVTLIELMITTVIGSIAFMALAVPFVAERRFWVTGNAQVEAQRDAQMAMRAIGVVARESGDYRILDSGGNVRLRFELPCGNKEFRRGPAFNGGQLEFRNISCPPSEGPPSSILIDGVRSRVTELTFTPVIDDKLVHVRLVVAHQNLADEVLETDFYLRNSGF